jgi:hypothetical protein
VRAISGRSAPSAQRFFSVRFCPRSSAILPPSFTPGRSRCDAEWFEIVPTEHSPSVDEQLRFAIANKRLIQLFYLGRRRVAEPHDYGILHGTMKLLVYQRETFDGGGSRHRDRGWRLFEVSKITECSVLDTGFRGSRIEGHQRHYSWDVVYARVT